MHQTITSIFSNIYEIVENGMITEFQRKHQGLADCFLRIHRRYSGGTLRTVFLPNLTVLVLGSYIFS